MKTNYLVGLEYYLGEGKYRMYFIHDYPVDDPWEFIEEFNSDEELRKDIEKELQMKITQIKYITVITKEYLDVGEQPYYAS